MNCEEFEIAGLDLESRSENASLQQAALQHVSACSRCAALQESWQCARAELRMLAAETQDSAAPPRVEMRLLQAFRTGHRTVSARRAGVLAAWALAAAALLVGVVSFWNWRRASREEAAVYQPKPESVSVAATAAPVVPNSAKLPAMPEAVTSAKVSGSRKNATPALGAENDAGEFTVLPGTVPPLLEDAEIVRVRLQRGALAAFGLPVNEEYAGEWILVDLVVGDDGQPQALRLVR